MANILVVDDDVKIQEMLKQWLTIHSWQVTLASDVQQALSQLSDHHFDLAILDLRLPDGSGIDVFSAMQDFERKPEVIFLTGYPTIESAVSAVKMGAKDYLQKPIHIPTLLKKVKDALSIHNPSPHILVEKLDELLQSQASQAGLQIKDICQPLGISPSYARQLLKKFLGVPFRHRLLYHRIEIAKKLISTTDDPLYAIAELSGFRNARRFSESFHCLTKIQPKEYRKISAVQRKK